MEFSVLLIVAVLSFCGGLLIRRFPISFSLPPFFSSENKKKLKDQAARVVAGQNEAVINDFVAKLDLSPATLGIHLSAAAHFRKSGEVEKAILIHRTVLENPALAEGMEDAVSYELAKDYIAAGLLDRAESLLQALLVTKDFRAKAIEHLVTIYQREKEWDKAIQVGEMRVVRDDQQYAALLAHFECEKAEQALKAGTPLKAQESLEACRRYVKQFPRATLLWLDIAIEARDEAMLLKWLKYIFKEGTELERQVAIDKVALLPVWDVDRLQLPDILMPAVKAGTAGVKATQFIADCHLRHQRVEQAFQVLLQAIELQPTEQGITRLLDCLASHSEMLTAEEHRKVAFALKKAVEKLNTHTPEFQCVSCGFSGNKLHWLCPSCHNWGAVQLYQNPSIKRSQPFLQGVFKERTVKQHE